MSTTQQPEALSLEEFRTAVIHAAREPLLAQITKIESELKELRKDRARLDWLDKQVKHHPVYSGYSWQEVGYENDRGLVCRIQGKKQKKTVRQAIYAAIAAQANKDGEKQ